jgi:putative inorganic carbon (hco3(-)) transporter
MGFGIALWALISLFAVAFAGEYPWVALGLGSGGGLGLGVFLWHQTYRRITAFPGAHPNGKLSPRLFRYETLLWLPSLMVLLFANRLPSVLLILALACFGIIWVGRISTRKYLGGATPMDLPILLLLCSAIMSLFFTVNFRQSGSAVCTLIASMEIFYVIARYVDNESKLYYAFVYFLGIGVGVSLLVFFFMQPPPEKLPFLPLFNMGLSIGLPRTINPNYLGGTLVLFLPLAVCSFGIYGSRLWSGLATILIGIGLLLTQSRSALLGVGFGLALVFTYLNRRFGRGLLFLVMIGGVLVYLLRGEISQDFSGTKNELVQHLEFRQRFWERAVRIAQDFPLAGIGLHSFQAISDPRYLLYTLDNRPTYAFAHAHNFFLDVVVSVGFFGYVAFGAILGAWGGMIMEELIRVGRSLDLKSQGMLGIGIVGGVIAHFIFGLTDAVALGEKAGVVFWVILGLTAVLWRNGRYYENRKIVGAKT